jgi:ATP-binding cassette subfamily B protein/subfamily B ATP-binding cassette protein MsbA
MISSGKKIWPYVRPYRRDLIIAFALGLGVTVASGFVPVLVQVLIEVYNKSEFSTLQRLLPNAVLAHYPLNQENREAISRALPFAFPIAFLVLGFFRFTHFMAINYTSMRIISDIRLALMRKIVRLNLTYHGTLEHGSGGLLSRVFNDPVVLQQGLGFYADLIREPIQAVLYLSYMIWLDWRLTICALLFMPFFIFITRKVTKSLRKYGILGRDAMDDLTAVMKDAIDGVRVVQSFNLESEMERRFQVSLDKFLLTSKRIITREVAVSPVNEFVISFLVMGFAIYSINQVLTDAVDSARFIAFLAAAGFLQAPIKKLQDAGIKIQQSVIVIERIFEVLELGTEVPETAHPKPFPTNWKQIVFKDVSFSYGNEMVLKNANLTIRRGQVVALVGESGSGKSTLVNLLERFYDPTSGSIYIDDTPITEFSLKDLRQHVALVTQDVFLFRDSIAQNIHAGDLDKDPSRIEQAARLANAHGFITATQRGYDNPVGERGSFLSGGEKQRVSIARAIFKDAPILILDEATSALDSVSEMEVQKGLNHLLEGRTALLIAHRLSTVFNADHIVVMKKGEIVEQGTHLSLLERGGEYHNFFQLQTKIS